MQPLTPTNVNVLAGLCGGNVRTKKGGESHTNRYMHVRNTLIYKNRQWGKSCCNPITMRVNITIPHQYYCTTPDHSGFGCARSKGT